MSRPEIEQSFYSVYSHESMFDRAIESNRNMIQEREIHGNIAVTQIKMVKIAQSNINLDDGLIQHSNSLRTEQRNSFETVPYAASKMVTQQSIKQVNIQIQNIVQNIQQHQISEIHPKQQQLNQSVSLIKEIDCLSVEQVSPQQLRQIKKKISMLTKQQFHMQNSLLLANQMLQSAKVRNTLLENQIVKYRQDIETRKQNNTTQNSKLKLQSLKQYNINKQKRIFSQFSSMDQNAMLNRLKLLYRQCSLNQSYCIYQNQGYKIQVAYNRQRHISEPKMLTVRVKLTSHHHIASKKQFKFDIQMQLKNMKQQQQYKCNINQLTYEGVVKQLSFTRWPEGQFNIQIFIHEIDEINGKHHSHSILIPLPITHFLQPRMIMLQKQFIQAIKKTTSQYTLAITTISQISLTSIQKMKQRWWYANFVSCLGWNQLIFFEIIFEEDNKNIKVQVFGKKNGITTLGLIQFLSFFFAT